MTSSELRDAFRYLFPKELDALKECSRCLYDEPEPIIVNIGSGAGTSTLAFLEANPLVTVYSVDKQLEDSPLGCLSAERRVVEQAGYQDRLIQIHNDSMLAGYQWLEEEPYRYVDIVFIDGDHSYEGCKGDIEAWLPNLKPGGLLLIHDYNKESLVFDPQLHPHPKPWPGVNKAVDELKADARVRFSEVVDTLAIFVKK